jgi:hypothetical protein
MSCAENQSDLDDYDYYSDINSQNARFLQIPEHHEEGEEDYDKNNGNNMTTTYSNAKYSPVQKVPLKTKPTTSSTAAPPASDDLKIDAAEVVYGKAKGIWAWGKTVPVVSFFVGTTETVASKALGVVGTDFAEIDGKLSEELAKLDTGVLNPAIKKIAEVLISAAGKSEDTLKPIIMAILKPLGLIKSEAQEATPEAHTSAPEITTMN